MAAKKLFCLRIARQNFCTCAPFLIWGFYELSCSHKSDLDKLFILKKGDVKSKLEHVERGYLSCVLSVSLVHGPTHQFLFDG